MGRMSTQAMIETGAHRKVILRWHLETNHVPPVPIEWIPCCEWVIDRALAGEDMDAPAPVPEGFMQMSAGHVLEGLHLDTFVQQSIPVEDYIPVED